MNLNFKQIIINLDLRLRKFPKIYRIIIVLARRFLGHYFLPLPMIMRREIKAVKEVLKTPFWNMTYASGNIKIGAVHQKLEEEFAQYIGTSYAISVNTGGVGMQMVLRALGINYGDEIIHRVDTCVANPFAIMNAGGIPIFCDIYTDTLTTSETEIWSMMSEKTKVLMPIHMWGYPEDMGMINRVASNRNLLIVEDCCLALGAKWGGRKVGGFGKAGIFSFGCLKPIQSGEGGIIVTNDEYLAKNLRTIRTWGDMSAEYGRRDNEILSWNGRLSEIVAAVMLEQLRAYPKHLSSIIENVSLFKDKIKHFVGIGVVQENNVEPSYTQVIAKIDKDVFKVSKQDFIKKLSNNGFMVGHASFEPINYLSFFKNNYWRKWAISRDVERVRENYLRNFVGAINNYENIGIGFYKTNFLTRSSTIKLIKEIENLLK